MPVTIAPNDVVTVRLEYTLDTESDVAFNVLHYQLASLKIHGDPLPSPIAAPVEEVLPTLAQGLFEAFSGGWKTPASVQVSMTGATAQKVFPTPRSEPFHYVPTEAVPGSVAGEALPLQDSATILKHTGYGQRWGLGRVYFVGLPESGQINGRLEPEEVAAMASFIDLLNDQFLSTNDDWDTQWRPVLFAPTLPTPRILPLTRTELSNNILKTQRRRRPGKGA